MKPTSGLTRREALKRGALFGGALVWTTPAVQAVGMRSALAADVSPGCLRFALKWEVDGNRQTKDLTCYLPDQGIDAQPIWTNSWAALGGKPMVVDLTEAERESAATELDEESAGGDGPSTTGPPEQAQSEHAAEAAGGADPGETDSAEAKGSPAKPEAPLKTPPGNCLVPPDDAINDDAAAASLTTRTGMEFVVYGSSETGLWVAFPEDCAPADIGVFAAAKCGNDDERCLEVSGGVEPDPCLDGYNRVFIEACTNGKEISHIELILDVCPR